MSLIPIAVLQSDLACYPLEIEFPKTVLSKKRQLQAEVCTLQLKILAKV